jgi:hypothetical protein
MHYTIIDGIVWITIFQEHPPIPFKNVTKVEWLKILNACYTNRTERIKIGTPDIYNYITVSGGYFDIGCIKSKAGCYALEIPCSQVRSMLSSMIIQIAK